MKNIIFAFLGLALISCSSHTLDSLMNTTDETPEVRPEFKTTKDLCEKASGVFDLNTNLCYCQLVFPFIGNDKDQCRLYSKIQEDSQTFTTSDNQHQLQIINEAKISQFELERFIKESSIPKNTKSRIFIFKNLKQFLNKNTMNNSFYFNTSFLKTQGSNVVETQIYFAPIAKPNLLFVGEPLQSTLLEILNKPLDQYKIDNIKFNGGNDCLGGCFISSLIMDSKNYNFSRVQTYSNGNRVFDTIRVINKFDNHLEVILVLFNQKISHYFKSVGNGFFRVYTNTGEVVSYSATIKEL